MRCPACGEPAALHELERHTAPSLLIDPETGLPPDTAPDGTSIDPTPAAMARARRRPICEDCLKQYEATGTFLFNAATLQKGDAEALVVGEDAPLVDDEGRVMAVRCPSVDCGKVVDLVRGRLERHYIRGRKCRMSWVPVVISED